MVLSDLNDVEYVIKKHLPNWAYRRGKKTYITRDYVDVVEHATSYEVIQLFKPGNNSVPYAEFWNGYYADSPEHFCGFIIGDKFHSWTIMEPLESIMMDAIEENQKAFH